MKVLSTTDRAIVFNAFCDLIDISDSFDQLGKIALILDTFYTPQDIEHKALFSFLEMTARHLKGLPGIGKHEQHVNSSFCGCSNCKEVFKAQVE